MLTKVQKPSEIFHKLVTTLMASASICGANIINDDYHMTIVTWCLIALINAYYAFTLYTIYDGVVLRSNYTVILESMCLCGTAIQGYAKLISAIGNAANIRFLKAELQCMYEEYERKQEKYQCHLMHSLHMSKRIVYTLFIIYALTAVCLLLLPLYYTVILKQQIFIMQFIIPGIDENTYWGYIIHLIVQAFCIIFGSFGNFASDTLFFLIVSHIPLSKNILLCKFNDLDETLAKYPKNVAKTRPLLKDIFIWHQRYIVLTETTTKSFYWVIFVQIGTATNSIICTIVCLFLGTWPAGPMFLIYSYVIMIIYCGLGNLVDIANDGITLSIYDSMWYELSVPEQKMIMLMLRDSQQAKGMSIGGVMPLSLNTALQLTKTIYTMAMILNEFLN